MVPTTLGPVYSSGPPGNAPYGEGHPATASDHFGGDPHSLVLSAVSNEFGNEAALAHDPFACKPRPPFLDRCDNGSAVLVETDWSQDMITEDAATERAARCGETGDSVDEEVTEERVEANMPASELGDRNLMEEIRRSVKDSRPTILSSSQPSPPVRPAEVTSKHARSLRHRHEKYGYRKLSCSVAVVIPAR